MTARGWQIALGDGNSRFRVAVASEPLSLERYTIALAETFLYVLTLVLVPFPLTNLAGRLEHGPRTATSTHCAAPQTGSRLGALSPPLTLIHAL